jgi:hypothetical protein
MALETKISGGNEIPLVGIPECWNSTLAKAGLGAKCIPMLGDEHANFVSKFVDCLHTVRQLSFL